MLAQSHMMQGLTSQTDQSFIEAALLASAIPARNSRPISWHPSAPRAQGLSNPQCVPDLDAVSYYSMDNVPDQTLLSVPVYGGEDMLSYPMATDSMFSPPQYLPVFPDMQEQEALPFPQQTPPLPMTDSQVEPTGWDINTITPDLSTMPQPMSNGWPLDMWPMNPGMPPAGTACPSYASVPSSGELSRPSTPYFSPTQQFNDESDCRTETKKDGHPEEELIGMGLYSQPDGSMEQTLQGTLGKGLKLEETFTPSEDQDDETDEEGSAQDVVQPQIIEPAPTPRQSSFTAPKQPSKPALNLLQKSFFFDNDDADQQTLTPARPFPSLNQSCVGYGYGWI